MRIGCLQMNSTDNVEDNLLTIERAALQAKQDQAQLLACPEMALYLDGQRRRLNEIVSERSQANIHERLADIARMSNLWLLAGLPAQVTAGGTPRIVNRIKLFSPDGFHVHYDKIHLFDVDLGAGERYGESGTYKAGKQAVILERTPFGTMGLSICYDLRFPQLFACYKKAGCRVVLVPSAFAIPTGKAHWQTLLCARAIETDAAIIAPAQCGHHPGGRSTYGHSMIISRKGAILADAADQPGLIYASVLA